MISCFKEESIQLRFNWQNGSHCVILQSSLHAASGWRRMVACSPLNTCVMVTTCGTPPITSRKPSEHHSQSESVQCCGTAEDEKRRMELVGRNGAGSALNGKNLHQVCLMKWAFGLHAVGRRSMLSSLGRTTKQRARGAANGSNAKFSSCFMAQDQQQ